MAVALAAVLGGTVAVGGAEGSSPQARGMLAYRLLGTEIPTDRSWIAVWDLGRPLTRLLTPPPRRGDDRQDHKPAWSPDGRFLAFVRSSPSKSGVYLVGADGKGTRRVVSLNRADAGDPSFVGPEWSPDGRRVVFDRYGSRECSGSTPFRHRLTIARVDGTGVVDIPALPGPMKYRQLYGVLSWSPDGKRILYSVVQGEYDDESPGACRFHGPAMSELYSVGQDGTGLRLLASAGAEFDSAAWSPDARRVAYSNCYWADSGDVVCDLAVVSADGEDRQVLSRGDLGEGGIAWSRDGQQVIANLGDALVAVNASTGARQSLGSPGEILGLSRDGRYVAVRRAGTLVLEPLASTSSKVVLRRPALPAATRVSEESDLFLR